MPSFDITSEADMVALKNAVDVAGRQVGNRYDFKGTSAKLEMNEKDKVITVFGDSEFQVGQVKDILFPEMEKKARESTKRLDIGDIQSISGNKAKQDIKIKSGVDQELGKKIVRLIKDSKLKVQATIQGDAVRVTGAKRDFLQEAIALVKKSVTDYPLTYGNFRD
ncbi:MAG TPA: YajQ family cyclic di-GMP-binding protein [Rhodocyclaceae bacterium]|nr:YajQ family cyclic di-GMP-binding protein [Rhodocyclaceae bacterium]